MYYFIIICEFKLELVCSTAQLAPRKGLSAASVVSLKDVLIGWHASDCDAPIRLWRIQINMGYTLPSPTWRASLTWRKQRAFPFPRTVALWVFWKSREFPAFFRGRGQSYARRHGTWNSLNWSYSPETESWVVTSVTLAFDLWPWPFCTDLTLVLGGNSWKFHDDTMMGTYSKRCDRRTEEQTDRRTENTIHRAAWLQLKIEECIFLTKLMYVPS